MKRRIYILLQALVITFMLVYCINPATAQQDLTIYPMQSIPQSNNQNPALVPDCKFFIGCLPIIPVPVLSSFYLSAGNSGFNYTDVVHRIATTVMRYDSGNIVSKLADKNYLTFKTNMELLSFGIKIKRVHYLSLSLTEKINFRFCYPKDLISLAFRGDAQYIGRTMYLDGLGLDFTHYRELALGYTYQYTDKWTLGGRAKLLIGLSNVWTQKSIASLGIDKNTWSYLPYSSMRINAAGSEEYTDYLLNNATSTKLSTSDYILNFNNLGGAIDLGASYKINKEFSVAASLLDFGGIFWKDGARNFVSPSTAIIYDGFPIEQVIRKNDTITNATVVKKVLDSIVKGYQLDTTKNSYWGPLNPTINLSVFYTPTKNDKVSFLAQMEIYKSAVHPAFTLGYYRKFGKALSVAVNYSYYNHSWLNLGFGAAVKVGPMQFFLTTDNVFAGIMPYKIKNADIHFGCDLVFYAKSYYPLINLYDKK